MLRLFWLGVAIGLTWEVPIFLNSLLAVSPIVGFIREPPLHPLVFMLAHSFWDGGLFLVGLALVRALCPHPVLASFRWRELGVLILWGQASELAVEVGSGSEGLARFMGGQFEITISDRDFSDYGTVSVPRSC